MAAVNYAPFWGDRNDAYTMLNNKMPRLNSIRRVVNRDGFRVNTELLDSLIGAVAGGTATATHARVNENLDASGTGRITTVTDINRATTAADVTALKEFLFNITTRPVPYPRDLSGNGGPQLA